MIDHGYSDRPYWEAILSDYLRWRDDRMAKAREWSTYTWQGKRTPLIEDTTRDYVRQARIWNHMYITARRMLNGKA